ncbi:MAG: Rieske (2Fe-2S) protein [Candidatus Kapabacteria bacterium]|nr:Rieske (2Fe-2S) protein [Candidatus Kapabacteria bacterium]
MTELKTIERRDFIKKSLVTAGIFLCSSSLATLLDSCSSTATDPGLSTVTYDVSTNADLQVDGGVGKPIITNFNSGKPVMILRITSTSYIAFSASCPHEGFVLDAPDPANGILNIVCGKHSSEYNAATGAVIKQPTSGTTKALVKFNTSYDSATHLLTISK